MPLWFPLRRFFVRRSFREQDLDHQQARATHNRAIRYVEGRPLILANVEEQEIHDPAVQQPIPEIAYRTAQDES